jgi:hypothetical protein
MGFLFIAPSASARALDGSLLDIRAVHTRAREDCESTASSPTVSFPQSNKPPPRPAQERARIQ